MKRNRNKNYSRIKKKSKSNDSRGSITLKKDDVFDSLKEKSFINNCSNITDNEYEIDSEVYEKKETNN